MTQKKFNVICAVSLNGVIGNSKSNNMPWHIPLDLKYFKHKTLHKTVVMGSSTFKSIGTCLKDRRNIVISRSEEQKTVLENEFKVDKVYSRLKDVFFYEQENFFIIGGGQIYEAAFYHKPTYLYITIVNNTYDGDVVFPVQGKEFLNDTIDIKGTFYKNIERTPWLQENGNEFQFTKFKII